ncbi:YadA-like family protein [Pasteurella canis]|uniref:YadA-like family protein n=1 Tax=Pasteurella canis TaxID=753 RepID=UPI00132A486D|nr:YadA-like family protein [Pasteurella canis]MXN89351.1 adhesin [Pasteurella canis]
MNKIYRTLWNAATQSWVVVSELAKSDGKSASANTGLVNGVSSVSLTLTSVATSLLLISGQVAAADIVGNKHSLPTNNDGNYCFFDKSAESVICGNESTKTIDKFNGKTPKSVVIGKGAINQGESNVALGSTAKTGEATAAIAIGNAAQANKDYAIAVGNEAQGNGKWDISIGRFAGKDATPPNGEEGRNIAIGDGALKEGKNINNNTALGTGVGEKLSGSHNVMLGTYVNAREAVLSALSAGNTLKDLKVKTKDDKFDYVETNNSVALGTRALATEAAAVAIGQQAKALGVTTVAIGNGSRALNNNSVAMGRETNAGAAGAIAIGLRANYDAKNEKKPEAYKTTGVNSVAIGVETHAAAMNSIAMGSNATVEPLTYKNANTEITDKKSNKITVKDLGTNLTGQGSISIGSSSIVKGTNAVAIGQAAETLGQNAFAGGNDSHANGKSAVAIGDGATALKDSSTAIGAYTKAFDGGAGAFAYHAHALAFRSLALGAESLAEKISSIAIGDTSKVQSDRGIAIGHKAQAIGGETANIAIGDNASADASGAIVLGTRAQAKSLTVDDKKYGAYSAIVIGTDAKAIAQAKPDGKYENPKDAIAIGTGAEAHYASAIALGAGAKSDTKAQAVSIGYNSNAKGYQAIAFGSEAKTTENAGSSIALGTKATTRASASIALGMLAETGFEGGAALDGANAVALGREAKAKKENSLAFGYQAIANNKNDVALGANSETSAARATTQATVSGFTYSGFAGTEPTSTVSVGKAGAERTITNVAAGRIDATSTDAINGSQLYLTQKVLGNVGNTVTSILGGNAQIAKDGDTAGNITMSDIGGTGKGTIHEAIQSVNNAAKAAKTQIMKGDNIVVTESAGADGNTIYTVATAKEVNFDKTTVGNVVIDKTTDDITGLANKELTSADFGTKGRAATEEQLSKAVNQVTGILGGNAKFENGAVTMTNIGDTGATNIHDAIKAVNATAKASKTTVVEGENITVTAEIATDGSRTYTVATKKDVKFDSAVAGGTKIDSNGLTFVDDSGNKIANSPSISKTGIDAGNQKVTNVQKGNVAKDSKDAVNGSQLFAQGESVKNIIGGNTTYDPTTGTYTNSDIGGTGKNTIDDAIKASRNEVEAGKNMTVTSKVGANGQTIYEVATKDNVEFKEVKVGPNVTINESGLQAGNIKVDATTNKISGIAKGEISATSTDAVNGSQLYATNQRIDQIGDTINKVNRKLRAGIAGANAAAGLPQAYIPGKSMVAAAVGTYKGENAIAVGMSRISDNGKVIIKLTGNTNSRGDFGGSIGAGYQW